MYTNCLQMLTMPPFMPEGCGWEKEAQLIMPSVPESRANLRHVCWVTELGVTPVSLWYGAISAHDSTVTKPHSSSKAPDGANKKWLILEAAACKNVSDAMRPPGKDLFIILTKHPIVFPTKIPIAERKSSESGDKNPFWSSLWGLILTL